MDLSKDRSASDAASLVNQIVREKSDNVSAELAAAERDACDLEAEIAGANQQQASAEAGTSGEETEKPALYQ